MSLEVGNSFGIIPGGTIEEDLFGKSNSTGIEGSFMGASTSIHYETVNGKQGASIFSGVGVSAVPKAGWISVSGYIKNTRR